MTDDVTQSNSDDVEAQDLLADAVEDEGTEDTSAETSENELGPKGESALAKMKEERKELKRQLREAKKEAEDLKASATKDDAPDADAIQKAADKAATEKANARILKAEVKAAAAGKLSDPADALRFIDLSDFEVGSDGDVDADEISEAIDDLLKNKPYLSAQGGKRFEGSVDTGARKATGPKQLTREDLKKMKPREINAAKAAGQLKELLGE